MATLLLPLLFLQVLVLGPSSAQVRQNITLGSYLTPQGPSISVLSPSGDFAFGFRPLDGNTSFYLLAIWFDKTIDKTVAWYAKSGAPVVVPSGSRLGFTPDGAFSLRDPANTVVWTPGVTGVAYGSMLDTGNFVLRGANGSPKWQSFTVPSDTILPTQVLPLGTNLHSRLMDKDYSDGRFLLAVQNDGDLVFSLVAVPSGYQYASYWSSSTVGNGQLVFNASGRVYYTSTNGTQINITSVVMDSMADLYHRATLDPDGVFRQYVYPKKAAVSSGWNEVWTAMDIMPRNICDIVTTSHGSGVCGFNSYCSFNWNQNQTVDCVCPQQYSFIDPQRKYKGCKADFLPQSCSFDEAAAMDQFDLILMGGVDWPLADYESYYSVGEDSCKSLCLNDCFCAVTVFHDGQCWKKKLPLSNGRMGSTVDRKLYLKVPKSNNSPSLVNTESSKWKKDKKHWILGGSLLLGSSVLVNLFLISVILFGTYYTISRKKTAQTMQGSSIGIRGLPLKAFTYKELEEATDGFGEEVGRGASGVVYRGQLPDEFGTCIAVKKIDKAVLSETEKEFAVEVQTIGQTFHKNLVRLLGFCNEGMRGFWCMSS